MKSRVVIVGGCLLVGMAMFFSLNALQSSEPELSGPGVAAATELDLAQSVERLSRQVRELKIELRNSKAEQHAVLRNLLAQFEAIHTSPN